MTNTEKLIKKLMKHAEMVQEVKLESAPTEITNLEDFYNLKGELFFNENTFYKKDGEEYYIYILGKQSQNPDLSERLNQVENWIKKYAVVMAEQIKDQGEQIDSLKLKINGMDAYSRKLADIVRDLSNLVEKSSISSNIPSNQGKNKARIEENTGVEELPKKAKNTPKKGLKQPKNNAQEQNSPFKTGHAVVSNKG